MEDCKHLQKVIGNRLTPSFFYDRLKENSKHTTQAQIAMMRKIIITAHSLYKNDMKYDAHHQKNEVVSVA